MNLLSSIPLLTGQSDADIRPGFYKCIVNERYIVVSMNDGGNGTIHVLSSQTGEAIHKQPYVSSETSIVAGLLLDGNNLIFGHKMSPALSIYNVPTQYLSFF